MRFPESQISDVCSKKTFIGAAMVPKRVGDPNAIPSQFFRSVLVTNGVDVIQTAQHFHHSHELEGTVRNLVSQFFTESTPFCISLANSFV